MDEALTNAQIRTIPEEEAGVVILNGEPYMIVDGEYVLYEAAQLIFQHRKCLREDAKLNEMRAAYDKKKDKLKASSEIVPPVAPEELKTKE